jgi:hypothetical protein
MQAILRPLRSKQQTHTVELLGRTGRGKIKVRLLGLNQQVFAADRFRLFSLADRRVNVPAAALDALPWKGAGSDPLALPPPTASALPDTDLLSTGDL